MFECLSIIILNMSRIDSLLNTDVTIIWAWMYVHDVILPSIYHLQRIGKVWNISVCTRQKKSIDNILKNSKINDAFPNQSFTSYVSENLDSFDYKTAIKNMPDNNTVVISVPDHLHFEIVMEALNCNQNVLCVKPLTLDYKESKEIAKLAKSKGLFVWIEYHKRFDNRSLLAKKAYEKWDFWNFSIWEAKMIEPWNYRLSNFQNWFTKDDADPFSYVWCHYVDLVSFITNLKVKEISVKWWLGKFPNGNEWYMWTSSRLVYENDWILSMTNWLGYPDKWAWFNEQSLMMFFEQENNSTVLKHDDQFRWCSHIYDNKENDLFKYVNPDFFQLIPWSWEWYKPTGYWYNSIDNIINEILTIRNISNLEDKKEFLSKVDSKWIIATPYNTNLTDLVLEAWRVSLKNNWAIVEINYWENPWFIIK